jgi:2'-5' RNA ligase
VVPEAEAAVGGHRARLDVNASYGIPAHVTVLAPFLPAAEIGPEVIGELGAVFAAVPRFGFRLTRTAWFGEAVLWLAPENPAPFRDLTARAWAAFPSCPPFGGRHDDVVPHLTVGLGGPLADLRSADEAVREHLPVDGVAATVTLMTGPDEGGPWARTARFPLAG